MAIKVNPVSKIIGLSTVLAAGFLMIVLAAAVWGNWLPILIGFIFSIAHVPTLLTDNRSGSGSGSFDDSIGDFDDPRRQDAADAGHFLEAFLLTTGVAMPLVLHHSHILTKQAAALSIVGGLLIYGTVVTFTTYFDSIGNDDDPFGM